MISDQTDNALTANAKILSGVSNSLLSWSLQSQLIASKISSEFHFLKIILKTKNDPILLQDWLRHHLQIVPASAIIIFDNMSDDERLLSMYEDLPDGIVVAQYEGFHNYLHVVEMNELLYKAVAESSDYFCIIDTDELLISIDENFQVGISKLAEVMARQPNNFVFPGTWISNCFRSRTMFRISKEILQAGRLWGKPIIRSHVALDKIILHNSQLRGELFNSSCSTNIFILHMKQLYPEQRIKMNIQKLVSRGFCLSSDSIECILNLDTSKTNDDSIRLYTDEIRRLQQPCPDTPNVLSKGMVLIDGEQSVQFYGVDEKQALADFLSHRNS